MSSLKTLARLVVLSTANKSKTTTNLVGKTRQYAVTSDSGAFLEEPKKVQMGLASITGTISAGLLLGAAISKNMASFLEENELFVPSDDDDDD